MLKIAKEKATGLKNVLAKFKKGNINFNIPNVPIFSKSPASIIEPGVGASTCASGSQVCSGTKGTLAENPKKKKTHKTF